MLSFLRFYNQARQAGMPPLSRAGRGLIRRWERRAIAGYWTHAGYLNWDTGLGFERWHQAKKLGLAQQSLIGIAQTRALQPGSEWGSWAKWLLDRGLQFYERLPVGEGGLPDPVLFKLFTVPQSVGSARLAAARLQANAARAVEAGLGRMRAAGPPALYAFDPDIGRLAVTTPAYNTAIVAVNQRAFPYGGIELARLFDGESARRGQRRRSRARGVRAARPRAGRPPGLLLPDRSCPHSTRRSRRCGSRARRAAPARRAATAPGQGVRRPVPRPARARDADRRALPRRHVAPLHPEHDRDQLAARAPLRAARGCASTSLLPSWGARARASSRCCATARA